MEKIRLSKRILSIAAALTMSLSSLPFDTFNVIAQENSGESSHIADSSETGSSSSEENVSEEDKSSVESKATESKSSSAEASDSEKNDRVSSKADDPSESQPVENKSDDSKSDESSKADDSSKVDDDKIRIELANGEDENANVKWSFKKKDNSLIKLDKAILEISQDQDITFIVEANDGFILNTESISVKNGDKKVDFEEKDGSNGAIEIKITKDKLKDLTGIKLNAKAKAVKYSSITATNCDVSVKEGDEVSFKDGKASFTVTPKDGYKLTSVTVNGEAKAIDEKGGTVTISNSGLHTDVKIVAVAVAVKYSSITATNCDVSVKEGDEVSFKDGKASFTVTPKDGYKLTSFTVNGEAKAIDKKGGTVTISNSGLHTDVKIVAKAEAVKYSSITAENCSVSDATADADIKFTDNKTKFTVTADNGYRIDKKDISVTVAGTKVAVKDVEISCGERHQSATVTFSNIDLHNDVAVEVKAETAKIIYTKGNFTVTNDDKALDNDSLPVSEDEGKKHAVFSVTATEKNSIAKIKCNDMGYFEANYNNEIGEIGLITKKTVAIDVDFSGDLELEVTTVEAIKGVSECTGGSIELNGNVYAVKANTGYHIYSISVLDDSSYVLDSEVDSKKDTNEITEKSISFEEGAKNKGVKASFAINNYSIKAEANKGEMGTVTIDPGDKVSHGTDVVVTAEPKSGYYISDFTKEDGSELSEEYVVEYKNDGSATLTFSAHEDIGVKAVFKKIEKSAVSLEVVSSNGKYVSKVGGTNGEYSVVLQEKANVTVTLKNEDIQAFAYSENPFDNISYENTKPVEVNNIDQNKTLYFLIRTKDHAVYKMTLNLYVDTAAPTVTLAKDENYKDSTWTNNDVIFTVTAADSTEPASGIKQIQYKTNEDGKWTVIADGDALKTADREIGTLNKTDNTVTITVNKNFEDDIQFKAIDNAGNESEEKTYSIKLDNTLPVLNVENLPKEKEDGAQEWANNKPDGITVSATDSEAAASGVEKIEYVLYSKNESGVINSFMYMNGWTELENNAILYGPKNETNNDNNEIIVDSETGNIAIAVVKSTDKKNEFTIEFFDNCNFNGYMSLRTVDKAHNYNKEFKVININVTDRLDPEGRFMFDLTPPTLKCDNLPNQTEWTNENTQFTVTAEDNTTFKGKQQSGIARIEYYSLDGGSWIAFTGDEIKYQGNIIATVDYKETPDENKATATVTMTGNYNGTIKFRAVDGAGNNSEEKSAKLMYDKTAPTIEVADPNQSSWTKADTEFTVTAEDNDTFIGNQQSADEEFAIKYKLNPELDKDETYEGKFETLYNSKTGVELKSISYKDNEIATVSYKATSNKVVATVTMTGNYNGTIEFKAVDGVERESDTKSAKLMFDNKAPTIESDTKDEKSAGWAKATKFNVTVKDKTTFTENQQSGIKEVQYSFDDENWTNIVEDYTAVDDGNIKFKEATVATISKPEKKDDNELSFDVTFCADYKGEIYFRAADNAQYNTKNKDKVENFKGSESVSTYIKNDTTRPQIIDVVLEKAGTANGEITYLSFGTFYNDKVKVTVNVDDKLARSNVAEGKDRAGSGVKSVKMRYDGGEIELDHENGTTYSCTLKNNKEYNNVSFYAEDDVGNNTDETKNLYGDDSNYETKLHALSKEEKAKNDIILLENRKPDIGISTTKLANEVVLEGRTWTSNGFKFNVKVEDKGTPVTPASRLYHVKYVYKNNDETKSDYTSKGKNSYGEDDSDNGSFKGEIEVDNDGINKITVKAQDNAGNTHEAEKEVYVDNTVPQVTGFDFTKVSYDHDKSKNSAKVETELFKSDVKKTNYGYYFRSDTEVTINVSDDKYSSGIKYIYYKLVNKDGKQTDEYTCRNVQKQNKGSWNEGTTTSCSFKVRAGFKGQIYAYVVDNVNNRSVTRSPDDLILETSAQHNSEKDHIVIDKKTSDVKDDSRNPLFSNAQSIAVTVKDEKAGIRKIEWSIENPVDGVTSSGSVDVYNNKKTSNNTWSVVSTEDNLITKMSNVFVIGDSKNEDRNGNLLKIKLTDRAGNVSEDNYTISIDKTAPRIDIKYDPVNPVNTSGGKRFFNKNRTATITVSERNFDASKVNFSISPSNVSKSSWSTVSNTRHPDDTKHVMTITYSQDADYTFDMNMTDRVGNRNSSSENHNEKFTIDKTVPKIAVVFDDGDKVSANAADNYYNKTRTATITITEHNFSVSDVKVNMTSTGKDNRTAAENPGVAWSSSGDVHTGTIVFDSDGKYTLSVDYTDLAKNKGTSQDKGTFYVDKTKPKVSFKDDNGKESIINKHAYSSKEDFTPIITATDYNLYTGSNSADKFVVTFTRNSETFVTMIAPDSPIEAGTMSEASIKRIYEGVFPKEEDKDGIYEVKAVVYDKAGNVNEIDLATLTYSLNRFGSTYEISDKNTADLLANKYGNKECDILVTEINPNRIDADPENMPRVNVIKNGNENNALISEEDFSVVKDNKYENDPDHWEKGYTYTIKGSNFEKDGRYQIILNSVDEAKNKNSNNNPRKGSSLPIEFVIDKNKPKVVISGIENGEASKEASVDLFVNCLDVNMPSINAKDDKLKLVFADETNISDKQSNFVLKVDDKYYSVDDINRNGEFTQDENSNEINIKLNVVGKNKNDARKVLVMVRDLAGNWSSLGQDTNSKELYSVQQALERFEAKDYSGNIEFTLNATWWRRLLNNTPLFVSLISGLVIIAGAVVFVLFRKKRKEQE